jgi:Leucine-rich repeat (LRR) protein
MVNGIARKRAPKTILHVCLFCREQQRLEKLASAALAEQRVAFLVPPATGASSGFGPLSSICPRLRELDLRANLFSTWDKLAEIGRQLPNLRILDISDNLLQPLDAASAASIHGAFPNLKVLIMNDMRGSSAIWDEMIVGAVSKLAPNLEELHAARNKIRTLVRPEVAPRRALALVPLAEGSKQCKIAGVEVQAAGESVGEGASSYVSPSLFPSLKVLNLTDNEIDDWSQVFTLSKLKGLNQLQLGNNKITTVWMPTNSTSTDSENTPFAALEQLSISGNKLSDLSSIDALDMCPKLTSLRLTNTDIADAAGQTSLGPSEARQIIVARLPKLASLNNSEVRPREREDAEKAYSTRVGRSFAATHTGHSSASITDVFPPQYIKSEDVGAYIVKVIQERGGSTVGSSPTGGAGAGAGAGGATIAGVNAPLPSAAALPAAFQKSGDTGVIRAARAVEVNNPYYTSPLPLCVASLASSSSSSSVASSDMSVEPVYLPELDPFSLGTSNAAVASKLQAVFPRYFMLAARYDLHAPTARDVGAASTIGASAVAVTLRSMAGSSCMLEPEKKRLPLNMTVLAVKQLAARLFKNDPSLQRLSFRDTPGAYPSLLDDDSKTLSYYAVCDGGEILIEEIDPHQAAREAQEAKAKREQAFREQQALGDALHKAQEASVTADRRAALATAAAATVSSAAGAGAGSAAAAAPAKKPVAKKPKEEEEDDAI